jgi:hypothetical protein
MVTSLQEMQDSTPLSGSELTSRRGGKLAYQLFFLAAQGLHGLAAFAAQGLHGLAAFAAQGLHGFALAAQGLHGFALTAQGLHGLALTAQGLQGLAFAAQGLHGFFCDSASAIPMGIANATTSAKTATNDTIRLMLESPLY